MAFPSSLAALRLCVKKWEEFLEKTSRRGAKDAENAKEDARASNYALRVSV